VGGSGSYTGFGIRGLGSDGAFNNVRKQYIEFLNSSWGHLAVYKGVLCLPSILVVMRMYFFYEHSMPGVFPSKLGDDTSHMIVNSLRYHTHPRFFSISHD
jgi:hypothetical protein